MNSINNTCIKDSEKIMIERAYGSKMKDNTFFKKLGFKMIRILLDKEIPCGFYEAVSHNGPVTLIIGKKNKLEAMANFIHYKPELETAERFEFWNIKRLSDTTNDIINSYNIGCC